MRRPVPARSVALERLERERLVPAPGAAELELVHPRIIAGGASRGRPLGPPPLIAAGQGTKVPSDPAGAGIRKLPGTRVPGTPLTDSVE